MPDISGCYPPSSLVGTAVLTLKGEGLVKSAWAQDQSSAQDDPTVLAQDTAPLPKDIADDSAQSDSPAEVDVLTSLAKRRSELDAREADLNMRANELAAAESRVDGKIATLKQLQDQITTLLAERDTEQEKQVASLVKTYKNMDTKKDAGNLQHVAGRGADPGGASHERCRSGGLMNNMSPDAAQKLSVKLANRLKLPDLAAPAAAVPGTPAAGQLAAATPQAPTPPAGK